MPKNIETGWYLANNANNGAAEISAEKETSIVKPIIDNAPKKKTGPGTKKTRAIN